MLDMRFEILYLTDQCKKQKYIDLSIKKEFISYL